MENFSTIYQRYYSTVFNYIVIKVKTAEIAEEITNDTFIAASNNHFDESKSKYSTWLLNIAKNKVIDFYRSKANNNQSQNTYIDGFTDEQGNSTFEIVSKSRNPQQILQGKELMQTIQTAINNLPEKYKQAIMLSLDGMKYEKIAKVLNMPVNTVKTRVARGKLQLQETLRGVY